MRITKFSCLILLGWLGAVAASAQLSNNVIISEFMANNATGITNNYGSHDDWIELYNAGSNTVNLADWCLTDNASKPTKWAFPSTNLAPARCLIVWASGKDIRTPGLPLHTSFKLGATPGGYLGLRRPDLSVATEFAPTYPAQTADISYGFPQSVATNPPVYFLTPTPGATNNYGTTNLGPVVTQAAHTPHEPLSNQTVIVTARILPTLYAVSNVTLIYRVMFSNEVTLLMNDAGTNGDAVAGDNIYSAILPAGLAKPGQMVRYAIITRDTRGNAMRSPEYLTTRAPQYYGFMIADPSLFSPVPIFHWFIQDFNAAAYDSPGAQAAFYFNGQFFDNVNNTIHGQSSTGFPKHSYNFNLNPGYKLTINPGIPNVGDFAILSTYADRSYMRNMVADDTYNMAGSPGHYAFAVRVQTNGSYFALQNLTEQGNEDFLQRIGFDPNGALYKIYNTLNVVAGNEKKTRKWEGTDDLQALINAVTQIDVNARLTYVYDNVNIPEVISFLSAKAINMDHDCCHKNHYLYHDNDGTGEWYAFAWDVDLSFGHVWTGNNGYYFDDTIYTNLPPFIGNNQTLFAVLYADPVLRSLWARRIRTDMDTILQPPGTPTSNDVMRGMMEYYAGLVRDEAALDRAKWPGTIWSTALYPPGNPTSDFSIELSRIENNFLSGRRAFLFINQVTNNAVLPQAQPTNTTILFGSYEYNPASSNQAQEYVELLNTNNYAADISGWKLDGGVGFTFKPGTVIPARSHIYVSPDVKAFRARTTGPRGGQQLLVVGPYSGQLSARGESLVLVNTAGRTNSTLSFPGAPSLAQQFLRITEIMYNPPAPLSGSYTAQDFEYIELKNISTYATLDLNGVTLTAGVDFAFTGSAVTTLAPGQRVLVVKNAAAFASRYGAGLTIAGTFTGSLDNAGERLRLLDASNEEILDFSYNNSWYPMTDGQGFSLVIANELAEPDAWDTAAGWRTSATVNGAPGREDMTPPVIAPILVNELLPRPTPPGLDTVELYNSTATNVDIGGWFLTDSFGTPKKWRIPNGTTIAAGGYLVFTESEFNPGGLNFSYSSLGEEVYLFSGNASNDLTGYYHGFVYDAADEGVSFGRYLNSQAKEDFVAQTSTTFGTNNAGPIVGPVVINEIMYHPAALTTNDSSTSFIELLNITATNVALYNLSQPSNTWHLRNAADFDFPTNLTLLPGGKIVVVGFDPAADATSLAAFRSRYSLSTNVPLYGPWQGNLPNNESVIELKKPDLATTTNDAPYVVVEKVHYHDSAPWPCGADGTGLSLQRQQPAGYGNEPNNWAAAAPTPASNNVVVAPIAPVVTVPPAAQTAAVGGTAIFTVTACGSPQFYQWRLQGTNLPAATNAALVLANAQASQAGSYSVVVWNSGGSVTSAPALLSVLIPPYFTEQPQTVTVNQTSNATFHVAVSGDSPIFIQWLFNGTNLPNATNATLTLTNIQISQDGPYVARAANGAGTAYSAAAFLNVLRPLVITSQPLNRSGFPLTNLSFTVGVSGSSPYAYQWRFNGSNLPNETNSTLLRLSVLPADSGTYTVVITNLISAVTSAPTSLTIWTNPLVTSAPQNQAIMTGSNATFSVVAVSTTPIRYQWYFNTNTLLTDATNSTLLVTNAQLSQVGAYSALLSDDYGSAMSPAGLLFLNLPTFIALHPQPSNVVAFVGSSVSFTAAVAGSPPFFFRWAKNLNAFTNFVQNETNTIFEIPSVQLSNGAAYNIVVTNLVINTNLISRNAYLTVIESLTNQAVPIGTNVTFRFTACTLNTTSTSPSFVLKYRWWFNETNLVFTNNAPNTCTNIFLNLTNVQPSNSGTYLVVATNGVGTVLTQAATLTVMQPPTITQQPADVIVSAGGTVSFDVTADGRPPLSYQWHLGSTPLEGGTASTLLFADAKTDNAGGYRAVVSNPDGSITSAVATLTVIMPPVIVQSPTNQTVRPGSNVTFNIVATGVGLTYQWRFNGSNFLAGATNATLALTNVQPAQAGAYQAMVINQAGALSSDAATLTINSGPVITQPPVPQTIECASNAVFTVLALGDPPLFYQWFFGTNSIPGANDSTLVVSNVTSSKAGNYSVLVTNQLGTNTSVPATLAVVDTRPPVILVCAPAQHYAANTNCQITLSNLTSSVIATDACSSVTITQVPPPGTVLGIGTTNVAFIATDTSGNASTCTVVVTVQDLAAPVIVFSFTNLTLAAGTNCQALMPNLTTTNYLLAVDSCSSVTVTQSVATSTPLALGTNLVVLTAFDTSGNTTFSTNAVVVVDATPPVITCPADLIVSADFLHTSKSNVTFIATATDNCNVTNISCVPSSGSTFPLGTNQVNCTATDASGNSAGCAFNIIVTPAGPVTATANQTVNLGIPDGSPVGLVNSLDIATSIERITNVTVTLNVSGGFNGDLHAYLIHDAGHAILLNRVGKTLANPSGYSDSGLNVTFTDSAANGDIHNYRQTLFGNPSMPQAGPLTNAWAPDGRDIDPALVLDSTPSTALLSAFHGLNPNGRWTLFIADVDAVYSSTLVSWGLEIRGTSAPPVITVQPQSRTNVAGSTAAFSVTATALSTPSYQWYFGPTAISGATNATLTLPDVQSTNAGDYMVIVTSLGGSTASDAARLTVQSLVVTGQVALQEYMGPAQNGFGIRTVTFKATGSNGSVLATWDLPLNFTPGPNRSGVAFYTLTNVPSGTIRLSAKTAWHLRSRLPATFTNGEAAVNFTGTQTLRGGDINGSNLVDMGDYNQLAAAWYTTQSGSDIDGSGLVDIFDYFLLASHWSQEGDPE